MKTLGNCLIKCLMTCLHSESGESSRRDQQVWKEFRIRGKGRRQEKKIIKKIYKCKSKIVSTLITIKTKIDIIDSVARK